MEEALVNKKMVEGFSGYLICLHRKNTPRISVKVCERSCPLKDECKEYRMISEGTSVKKKLFN